MVVVWFGLSHKLQFFYPVLIGLYENKRGVCYHYAHRYVLNMLLHIWYHSLVKIEKRGFYVQLMWKKRVNRVILVKLVLCVFRLISQGIIGIWLQRF
jgi:hypothetical protein